MASLPYRNFIIFLGAGFSVDAGLPIMSEFGKQSRIDYETLKKESNKVKNAVPLLTEAADKFYALQKVFKESPTIKDIDNFERIFCIVEAMIEAGVKTIPLENEICSIEKLQEQLQLWLWKIYQQSPTTNPERKTNRAIYTKFFSWLRKSGYWDQVTIISTNYDLMFEYLIWEENNQKPCTYYPFGELTQNIKTLKIGDGIKCFTYCAQDKNKNDIPVCKLHGSINYFENKSSDNSDLYVTNDIGGTTEIGKSGPFEKLPAIFAVDAIWKIRNDYGQGFTPAIIPPTYAKLNQKKWQKPIWEFAFNAICKAKNILFIGYSMPQTDGFIRALIDGAFSIRDKRMPFPKIFVIDPSNEVLDNYRNIFGKFYQDIGKHTLASCMEKDALKIIKS